jgi:RHS repeat-associated protein
MTSMPHLAAMDWDYADRLRHTQKGAGGGAQHTYFTYDATGQRARKVAVASGTVKERFYLGGYEVYRERAASPGASIDFERQTLHVMDDQRRVAMAETKTREGGAAVPTLTTRWRLDDETGLYYHGARYYAPWLGRWTAADPVGLLVDAATECRLQPYDYAANRPTKLIDSDGLEPLEPSSGSADAGKPAKATASQSSQHTTQKTVSGPPTENRLTSNPKEVSYHNNFPEASKAGLSPKAWLETLGPAVRSYLAKRLGVTEAQVDDRVVELVLAQAGLETDNGRALLNWNLGNIRAGTKEDHVYVPNAYEDYKTRAEAEAANRSNRGLGKISEIKGSKPYRITYPRADIEGARFASHSLLEGGVRGFLEKSILADYKGNKTSVGEAAIALQNHLTDRTVAGKATSLSEAAKFYHKKLGRYATGDDAGYIFALKLRVIQMNPDRDKAFYLAMKKQRLVY